VMYCSNKRKVSTSVFHVNRFQWFETTSYSL
jgi:hypothetical protein